MKKTITFKVKSNINHKYYYRKAEFNLPITGQDFASAIGDLQTAFQVLIRQKVCCNIIDTVVNEDKMYKKYLKIVRKYCHKTVDKYFNSML